MWQLSPDYRAFCAARDAWLMFEGLNDVDPFVQYPPCYSQSPFTPEESGNSGAATCNQGCPAGTE